MDARGRVQKEVHTSSWDVKQNTLRSSNADAGRLMCSHITMLARRYVPPPMTCDSLWTFCFQHPVSGAQEGTGRHILGRRSDLWSGPWGAQSVHHDNNRRQERSSQKLKDYKMNSPVSEYQKHQEQLLSTRWHNSNNAVK